MKDLTKKYMDELKGVKNYDFLEALVESAEKYGWIENEELRELLFFAIDLNSAAFAYLEAQKKGTRHTNEMRQGFSPICVQTMAGIFSEIKNKSDDKWRNMGK